MSLGRVVAVRAWCPWCISSKLAMAIMVAMAMA
jgi:hypothetical protein